MRGASLRASESHPPFIEEGADDFLSDGVVLQGWDALQVVSAAVRQRRVGLKNFK